MNNIKLNEISTEELLQILKLISEYIKFIETETENASKVIVNE